MPIDWSKNENNVKLLASAYAVLGKETFARERCFVDIAQHFGDGASYDAIQKRFKAIAAQAETLRGQVTGMPRPTTTNLGKPERPKKRPRCDDTIRLESDDLEVIEQGRFRTPTKPLRKPAPQPARSRVMCTNVGLSSDIENTADEIDVSREDQSSPQFDATSPGPSLQKVRSPNERKSNVNRPNMPPKPVETIDCTKYRQMYTDNSSANISNNNSSSVRSPQIADRHPREIEDATPKSYISAPNRGCVLCQKKWTTLQQAHQHERESDLHHANLLIPERVHAANITFIEMHGFPPPALRPHEGDPRGSGQAEATQPTLPTDHASASCTPARNSPDISSTINSRESSVIVVDGPARPEKGKFPAKPTPGPAHVKRDLRTLSTRHTTKLPRNSFGLIQEEEDVTGDQWSGTPSTSEYIVSSYDEEDEDMDMYS